MGLIRFLFFVLIVYVLWFLARNWMRKQELRQNRQRAEQTKLAGGRVVQCKHCEVHLPEDEAMHDGDDWFCNAAHRQAWIDRKPRG